MTPVSMAKTAKEKAEQEQRWNEGTPADEMEDYPYGLTLRLTHSELQKLGLAQAGLESGDIVAVMGSAAVKGTTSEFVNGMQQRTVELQIQTLALGDAEPATPHATAIFGD